MPLPTHATSQILGLIWRLIEAGRLREAHTAAFGLVQVSDSLESWHALATVLERLGQWKDCISALERALRHNPNHPALLADLRRAKLLLSAKPLSRIWEGRYWPEIGS